MKVYTEVNYEFKNGVLVEQSSKSFDYCGEVEFCGGGGGSAVTKVINKVVEKASGAVTAGGDVLTDTIEAIKNPAKTIREGPKGTLGDITDKLYGGSFKDLVEGAQGKDPDAEEVDAPVLSAEEVDPEAALTAQSKKRKELAGRGAANLTAGQSATMLTGP
jgi:hypothetical protein